MREDEASGSGDTDRETGSGTWDGVRGIVGPRAAAAAAADGDGFSVDARLIFTFEPVFATTFDAGFFLAGDTGTETGEPSSSSSSSTGVSWTLGSPACGPLKFRMDEKCSQSWYLRARRQWRSAGRPRHAYARYVDGRLCGALYGIRRRW